VTKEFWHLIIIYARCVVSTMLLNWCCSQNIFYAEKSVNCSRGRFCLLCKCVLCPYCLQPGKTLPQGATILKLVTSQAGTVAAAGKPAAAGATVAAAGATVAAAASPTTPQQLQVHAVQKACHF